MSGTSVSKTSQLEEKPSILCRSPCMGLLLLAAPAPIYEKDKECKSPHHPDF